MQYAVIRSGGKQYRVSEGESLVVDKLTGENKNLVFDEVLLVVNDGKATIGNPLVKGARVEASLVENMQGDKIRVSKYKAKVRYRKTIGFRAQLSKVKINKISFGTEKAREKTEKSTKTAPKK